MEKREITFENTFPGEERPEEDIKMTEKERITYELWKEGHLKDTPEIWYMNGCWSGPDRFDLAELITIEEAKKVLDKNCFYDTWIDRDRLLAITIDENDGLEIPIWLLEEFKEYELLDNKEFLKRMENISKYKTKKDKLSVDS